MILDASYLGQKGEPLRPLKIAVIDLVTKAPTRALYARIMHANLASIMPQVVAVWCEEEGHEVTFVCYTGFEDIDTLLPDRWIWSSSVPSPSPRSSPMPSAIASARTAP